MEPSLVQKLQAFKDQAGCDFQTAGMLVLAEALWGIASAVEENDICHALRECITTEELRVRARIEQFGGEE